jgi:hypothetical protein
MLYTAEVGNESFFTILLADREAPHRNNSDFEYGITQDSAPVSSDGWSRARWNATTWADGARPTYRGPTP